MDIAQENYNPNPRDKANIFSILFFTYTFDTFKKGYCKELDVDDLYNPMKSDRSTVLGDRLEKNWTKHSSKSNKTQKKPSLLKVLIATFWSEYLYLGCNLFILEFVVKLSQPLLLGKMLTYFHPETTTTKTEALWYAGGVILCNGLIALLNNQYIMDSFHYGMKVRIAICALVYRKALRLSKTALGETSPGKIVNLLSNDVNRFDLVSLFLHYLWIAPISAICITIFLYKEAGYAGIIGVALVFLIVPLQSYTGKLSAIYRKQTALRTDERVRLMDEVISGVQVIKMYAWEKPFRKLIKLARKAELKKITKASYVRGLIMTFNLFTTRAALFASLLTMVLTDQKITAAEVFVFMSYFNILSQSMAFFFIRGISETAEMIVGTKRIEGFLLNDEYHSVITKKRNENIFHDKTEISLKDLTVKWNLANSDDALKDINLDVNNGKLIGIIGPVGSGKSSLLQTLLGELKVMRGTIEVNGSISYASQEPWVFAATIRQNILFGEEYDKTRYNKVVQACSLEKDFGQFENKDLTIVGERGTSLSGGQKARVNLARALYREADIYLLDDPLSAVDIHVSKHLYDQCINGFLSDKTRILVTHQVHHLKDADHIVILNNGAIEQEGTFKELTESDNLYAQLLTTETEITEERPKQLETAKNPRRLSLKRQLSINSVMTDISITDSILSLENDDEEPEINLKDLQEESSKGKVKGSLFWKYWTHGNNVIVVSFILLLFGLSQLLASGLDLFVSKWVNIEEFRNYTNILNNSTYDKAIPFTSEWSTEIYIYIYSVGLASLLFIALARSMLFYKMAMWSSQNLHDIMFNSIISAPMRFFDKNPSGRILNRFSKDIGAVDELIPKVILDALQMVLIIVGSVTLVAVVNPYFLIMLAVLGIIFLIVLKVYLKSSKNIKRLEGIMRSPVFTHLNATMQGLTTIRSFGTQEILMKEFDKHQDIHSSAWFMYLTTTSALGISLDLLCFSFVTVITLCLLLLGESMNIQGGEIGLAITQAINLSGILQWGIRRTAEVSTQLMSVERVLEYEGISPEVQPKNPKQLSKGWPHQGIISFTEMGLKYIENGPLALKNLNLVIKPKEKVGIVGRTGAGKSTLIAALFRLAQIEGEIIIDGIDTKDITLTDLRSKISIIPQDPVLFSGTLRYNLDPFEEYPDDLLYKAIEEVELKDPANIINRLENKVMERGSNYSVGQRQLICLARAIIRNNKILMLDEATANVDPQTDALIQKTIRKKFADCTVLTVAHRLNTIMDSDKVLVMDSGTMAEFDHPHLLLQNNNGIFYKMVADTGRNLSEQLKRIAKDNYQKNVSVAE